MNAGAGRLTFLVDRSDDPEVVSEALIGHDPNRRQITVHPTVGTQSVVQLASDILRAAGINNRDLGEHRLGSAKAAFAAAASWLAVDDIEVVIVLRAHLLNRAALPHLAALAGTAQLRMVLVWHAKPPRSWVSLVPDHSPQLITETDNITHVLATPRTDSGPNTPALAAPPQYVPYLEQLPQLPEAGVAHFLADAWRTLTAAQFAAVEVEYRIGRTEACRWLAGNDLYRAAVAPTAADGNGLLPAALSESEIPTALALLRTTYTGRELATLTTGLLCLGRPSQRTGLLPIRFSDVTGLQTFLSDTASSAPTPRHAIARIRGVQAGLLLHGLLLQTPTGLSEAAGPGLSTTPFTPHMAQHIRRTVPHPTTAAALTMTTFTGCTLGVLKDTPANPDPQHPNAILLRARWPARRSAWAIPATARPILAAARTFTRLTDGTTRPLLAGVNAKLLQAAAAAAELPLPNGADTEPGPPPWHALTTAWWVGDPLHGPGASPLDTIRPAEIHR